MADGKADVLVVANQTAESDELLAALRERSEASPASFTLLIPATPHGVAWAGNMFAGGGEAQHHLDGLVERIRGTGIDIAKAMVGDPDALAAIQDAVGRESYDELIVSTLPLHVSKWFKMDLPSKAAHATGLPVQHVEASKVG